MTKSRTIVLLLAASLGACAGGTEDAADEANVVNVYNWADYIALDTLDKFEAEFGIKVNYDAYDASATVDVKMLTGNSGYDVVVHANTLASRLIDIGVYQKLDLSLLPNLKNLDPEMMKKIDIFEAIRGYYVPYHWGSTGFAWNVEMVSERLPGQRMDTSAVLFEPSILSKLADCGVSFFDGTTSLLPLALSYLGLDPNASDAENLALAERQLLKVRPYVRYFSNDKYMSDLPNKELCIAMTWSGEYATSQRRAAEAGVDVDLEYVVPVEGAPLWVDGIYIPADAPHSVNAHKFINFLLRADIAAANARSTDYANANAASWKFLDNDLLENPAIYPDDDTWRRLYKVTVMTPEQERLRTRTLARVKSGL